MDKLIEIAKECGADVLIGDVIAVNKRILAETVEQVCAPLVGVIELVEIDINNYMKHRDIEKLLFAIGVQLVRIRAALPAHRAIMGDKE